MKVRIKNEQATIRAAFERISQTVDTATGEPRRWESLDALKARIPLETVVAQYLEQEPEDPDVNRLKFYCFKHEPFEPDGTNKHTPSLYVNVEQQRWGCEAGCFGGHSGDLVDFIRQVLAPCTQAEAEGHLRAWDRNHNRTGRIAIRVKRERRR